MIESLPNRTLYLHELNIIESSTDKIKNVEPLYFEEDNRNSVICFFITLEKDIGKLLFFNPKDKSWSTEATFSDDTISKENTNKVNNIFDKLDDLYTEYGVYNLESE